ncbi:MAG TPA: Minf_1886 family protein [Tepidisphaeraceae bacterium]|jgi:uncharacterized repeat protein (TIGR04138 family)|nr:Minf_1886 family protein [Tepidisphaeraceae bacterium]
MPPPTDPSHEPREKSLSEVVEDVGVYPMDAFHFVQQGLAFAVECTHGRGAEPGEHRHISGQQLCEGLRQFALGKWGMLARTVLNRWSITSTMDFGRIVYALIDAGHMQKTDRDSIEDFRNVYDFKSAFEVGYRIESHK